MKLLSVLALLLTVLPVRSQSIDRPESPNYLYLQFIASQTRAFIRALDDLSNNQSDLRLQAFFKSWQALPPQDTVQEPLIDTLYRLVTDIRELNAAGASIPQPSPTRYDFLFPQQHYILPDSCFSRTESTGHHPRAGLAIEADYTYPHATAPDRVILITEELDWVFNCALSRAAIPGVLFSTPTGNRIEITYEEYEKYIQLLKSWIPIRNGFGGFDYRRSVAIQWLSLNASHTKARAEIAGSDWYMYRIQLEPVNGRWKIVRMEEIGEWCE